MQRKNYRTHIPALPYCSISSKPNGSVSDTAKKINYAKYFLLPIIVIVAVIIFFYGLETFLQVEIQPASVYELDVNSNSGAGNYSVMFALEDSSGNVGSANGYVSLKIYDNTNATVYDSYFRVWSSQFAFHPDTIHGGKVLSYSWVINATDITPVSGNTTGSIQFFFLSMDGHFITASYKGIELPRANP